MTSLSDKDLYKVMFKHLQFNDGQEKPCTATIIMAINADDIAEEKFYELHAQYHPNNSAHSASIHQMTVLPTNVTAVSTDRDNDDDGDYNIYRVKVSYHDLDNKKRIMTHYHEAKTITDAISAVSQLYSDNIEVVMAIKTTVSDYWVQ